MCPVPKKKNPKTLNDYRNVALTKVVTKCSEKLVHCHLSTFALNLDPLQLAYNDQRSVNDSILTFLHNAFSHLSSQNSSLRIPSIDFSSTYNTISPHLLALKLRDPKLNLWLLKFPINRSQSVHFQSVISSNALPHRCMAGYSADSCSFFLSARMAAGALIKL